MTFSTNSCVKSIAVKLREIIINMVLNIFKHVQRTVNVSWFVIQKNHAETTQ